jgi:hypothetical protein
MTLADDRLTSVFTQGGVLRAPLAGVSAVHT